MNEEIEFLEYIYQNAKMGQESIARLIHTRNKKDEIELVIKEQLYDYRKISGSAKSMIERRRKKAKEIGLIEKIATYMSIKFELLKNDSSKEVASILINGSKMGIKSLEKHLEEYKSKNKNVINLANKLLEIEKENIECLEKFLV